MYFKRGENRLDISMKSNRSTVSGPITLLNSSSGIVELTAQKKRCLSFNAFANNAIDLLAPVTPVELSTISMLAIQVFDSCNRPEAKRFVAVRSLPLGALLLYDSRRWWQ